MENKLNKISQIIIYSLLFFVPFFFISLTQEYFITNKFYLLTFGAIVLIFISFIKVLISKKISWIKKPLDKIIIIFLTSVALSTIFTSPNRIQALLNPSFGLVSLTSLTILYFYISRSNFIANKWNEIVTFSSLILSIITIFLFFQPFKNIALPENLIFLRDPSFSPVGFQIDLAILLGFFLIFTIFNLLKKDEGVNLKITKTGLLIINLISLLLTIYVFIRESAILPPIDLSFYAALEIFKKPLTLLFGFGIDNFSSVFTRVKDFKYNQSSLWQVNSFNVSGSAILHILTETGLIGLFSFGLLIFSGFKQRLSLQNIFLFIYLIICLFVFPSSLIVWFIFFITLGLINQNDTEVQTSNLGISTTDLSELQPVYIGFLTIAFILITTVSYFMIKTYRSEYYFKKSLDGLTKNSVKKIYDNQRKAIILNPYIERYRNNFAQTNLLVAIGLTKKDPKNITDQDKQTITQAIQAAISESKVATSLNPQKAENWKNLAVIYTNIINVAEGADAWAISAYQRAILADPKNPIYRLDMGGVYYSKKNYDEALKFFAQAVSLKPGWPNAHYNLAWAYFQKNKYSEAISAMQNTLNFLDPNKNIKEYDKAQKELNDFINKSSTEDLIIVPEQTQINDLNLPTEPIIQISPQLELQKEASPEAN